MSFGEGEGEGEGGWLGLGNGVEEGFNVGSRLGLSGGCCEAVGKEQAMVND